ncbi:Na+/H+ antiporter subunit E [Brachybacterium sp. EF45031]|uniref:Na+/H+ antiporter subunit E n=1 Tax=Brachybacterium sillae TaxID=2810536 RepID=UPI00217E1664|nr:Na+/H+ antiporter subunit E [Brachybacterium sillae]MCS6712208.1 Na+/H+ antiporter subunit E [Brachybacterium sillae]
MTSPRLSQLPHRAAGLVIGVAFWCLLWGEVSVKSVLGGIVASLLVHLLFPMPPTSGELTVRPWPFLVLVGRFALDVARSSAQVSRMILRPGPAPRSSVVAVQLASRSDFFLTATALAVTLIPGSVVVEAQRSTGTLFLHVIGAEDEQAVEDARRSAQEQEQRLLRAMARRPVLEEVRSV